MDVAIYDLNLWSIRDALIAAHRRGVDVRMVTESDNMDEQEVQELKEAGIEVLGDRHESLMHDKFVVIDRLEVWTGSMNFTTGGAYLDNNNLIRLRSSKLAEDYTRTNSSRCSWMTTLGRENICNSQPDRDGERQPDRSLFLTRGWHIGTHPERSQWCTGKHLLPGIFLHLG